MALGHVCVHTHTDVEEWGEKHFKKPGMHLV